MIRSSGELLESFRLSVANERDDALCRRLGRVSREQELGGAWITAASRESWDAVGGKKEWQLYTSKNKRIGKDGKGEKVLVEKR